MTDLEFSKMFHAALVHISPRDVAALEKAADQASKPGPFYPVYRKAGYGFFVLETPPDLGGHDWSSGFRQLMSIAHAEGADWVDIDKDGPIYDDVSRYDDEWDRASAVAEEAPVDEPVELFFAVWEGKNGSEETYGGFWTMDDLFAAVFPRVKDEWDPEWDPKLPENPRSAVDEYFGYLAVNQWLHVYEVMVPKRPEVSR